MALINCSNCDKQVSDKAKICPHCGQEIVIASTEPVEEKIYLCEECGTEVPTGVEACPNCGCPVPTKETAEEASPQKVEIAAVSIPKVSKKTQKNIFIAAAAIIALLVAILIGTSISKKQEAEAYRQQLEQYEQKLETASFTMLMGAIQAEEAGNLIKNVWYNSIYKNYDSTTDKYTRPKGYFVSDFNTAIGNLFSDSDFLADIESIETSQETIATLMKELKNPPEEYKEAYQALKELYEAFNSLANLATNPTGNLTSFSQNFNTADTEFSNCYSAMDLYLD